MEKVIIPNYDKEKYCTIFDVNPDWTEEDRTVSIIWNDWTEEWKKQDIILTPEEIRYMQQHTVWIQYS